MKKIIVAVCTLAVLAALLVEWHYSYRPGGLAPLAVVRDHHGDAEGWVASLIEREGGLPKVNAPLTHFEANTVGIAVPHNTARADVFPVANWEVESVTLRSPYSLLTATLKSEMLYSIWVDFRVDYTDGDILLLRWDTWRYGVHLGPVAVDQGGGPAGDIVVLAEMKRP